MRRPADKLFGPDDVRLGYVSGLHGVRGELKIFLYNPLSDLVGAGQQVELVSADGARSRVELALRPGAGRRILGRIAGVSDRAAAEALMGCEIVVPRARLPEPAHGEWYHRDLVGLPVRTVGGRQLGRIREIHSAGEVDVWLIRGSAGVFVLPVLLDRIVELRTRREGGDDAGVVVTDDAADAEPPR